MKTFTNANYDFLIYSLLPSPVENERKDFNMTNR